MANVRPMIRYLPCKTAVIRHHLSFAVPMLGLRDAVDIGDGIAVNIGRSNGWALTIRLQTNDLYHLIICDQDDVPVFTLANVPLTEIASVLMDAWAEIRRTDKRAS